MSKDIRKMIDKVKNFKQFVNENIDNSIMVGGYKLDNKWYDQLYDEDYGVDEDELNDYLKILDEYQNTVVIYKGSFLVIQNQT